MMANATVKFVPAKMRLAFDPQSDPRSPWLVDGQHEFHNTVFAVRVPDGFRSDLASIPLGILVKLIALVGLVSLWLLLSASTDSWSCLAIAAVMLWAIGKVLQLGDSNGLHQRGALFHDAAYRVQFCSRSTADQIFRAIMEHDCVPWWRRELIYVAVRLFGWIAWKDNAQRVGANRRELASRLAES